MAPSAIRCCLSFFRWFPVLFIVSVIVWSYYAYVIILCAFTVENTGEKVIYLLLYHPLIIMFLWAYWQATFTQPGAVPKQFYLAESDVHQFEASNDIEEQRLILEKAVREKHLPVQNRTVSGAYRYCEKCKCIKPDRAHHCSVCGMCILKMDHHCPWVNNCVSFTSYKFFVLFLAYGLVYCLFVSLTVLKYFVDFWSNSTGAKGERFHILFLFFASLMFSISLVSLLGYHSFLTAKNRSTLEAFRAPIFRSGPDKDGFSLGWRGNFHEIFGDNKLTMFLPIYTSLGDGVTYPTRLDACAANYNTMGKTDSNSYGDGVSYATRTEDIDEDSLLGRRQRWAEEGEDTASGSIPNQNSSVMLINEQNDGRIISR